MLKKFASLFVAFAAVCLTLGLATGLATAPASADIAGLKISQVGYNAVGADSVWNRNAEYVDVANVVATPVDVKGLTVSDSWAKAKGDDNPHHCNTFTISALPDVAEVDGKVMLPVGHTVRVYVGAGTPKTFGTGNRIHALYMNSRCGYHGHIFNNSGDTVWIEQGILSDSLPYNFETGYYIR